MINENKRRDEMLQRLFTQVMTIHSNASTTSKDRNSTYQIMPDLSKSIPTFDGEGDSTKAQEWLRRLEAMQQLHHWTDSLVLQTAKANLRGGAVYWLERQSSSIKKWEDFVKYCWDVGLTLEDTKEQILIGMWNREVCSVIAAIKLSNLDDLLHDMIKKERLIAERQGRIKGSIERKDKHKLETRPGKKEENCNYTPNADRGKPENKAKKHPYTRLPPRNEEGKPPTLRMQIGASQKIRQRNIHIPDYLPGMKKEALINGKPIQAYVDQGSKCVLLRRSEAERLNLKYQAIQQNFIIRGYGSESSETLVTSSREEDKEGNLKYFKEALINGKPIQAYVDQGSKCVLLRRSEAERLNLKYQAIQQNFIIRGYGSGEVKPLGKLEAYVEVDEAKAVTEMFVLPDQVQQIPLLIGQPFTEQRHVTIIRRRNTLRLFNAPMTNKDEEDGDDLRAMNIPNLPKATVSLWPKYSVVIPPNHVGFVTLTTDSEITNDLFVEAHITTDRIIPRCILRPDRNNEVQVPINNLTLTDIKICR
ncbi:hypothetical protein QE152_g34923 [Popillia japonica]|uniref:Retrotransposon gag domain-containing protein n=1 Tax=Popillia japonica TaxID=7064 RepID=A0AAW1IS96_POPJA